jgi:hypothetical protein
LIGEMSLDWASWYLCEHYDCFYFGLAIAHKKTCQIIVYLTRLY